MARRGLNLIVPIFVALLVAMPLAARDSGKNGKATSAEVDILSAVTLAGKQLKPGTIESWRTTSKVTVSLGGKVVAEAPVEWKDETSKPRNSNMVSDWRPGEGNSFQRQDALRRNFGVAAQGGEKPAGAGCIRRPPRLRRSASGLCGRLRRSDFRVPAGVSVTLRRFGVVGNARRLRALRGGSGCAPAQ